MTSPDPMDTGANISIEGTPAWATAAAARIKYLPGLCLAVAAFTWALRQASPSLIGRFWDDALFFRRVAYNIVHHGVGAWNVVDGPVFVNTSQTFQLIAAAALALFPGYYNAAILFWSAFCVCLSWWILWRAAGAGLESGLLAFFFMLAPSAFFTIGTGMETATVLAVISASVYVALRGSSLRFWLPISVAVQLAVYFTRPDAVLLSLAAAPGLLIAQGQWRKATQLVLLSLLGIGLLSAAFYAYYGTAVPLAAYLKVSPLSVYDQHYLGLADREKLRNLGLIGLTVLVLAPLIACRIDAVSGVLCAAGLTFIAYHGLTTNEIMASHARFYAPSLPLFFVAALRGLASVRSTRQKALVVAAGVGAAAVIFFVFSQRWIETEMSRVGIGTQYLVFALGTPMLAVLLLCSSPTRTWGALVACLSVTMYQVSWSAPASAHIVADADADRAVYSKNSGQVGIEVIRRCFEEPLQIMHSELGIPGVLFPESRILDFTGLANPAVAQSRFDFEQLCETTRPEFIFRPHVTHQRLNRELDQSPCLAQSYARISAPRYSSCPLHVRKDLLARFTACL